MSRPITDFDRTDALDVPVGTLARVRTKRGYGFTYRNEADIRDAIAAHAWALGWDVQTEVVIPGWGRLDVLLWSEVPSMRDGLQVAIEVKRALSTPAAARRAFQQADGYRLWLKRDRSDRYDRDPVGMIPHEIRVILTAPTFDLDACSQANRLYDVELRSVRDVLDEVSYEASTVQHRALTAWRRVEASRRHQVVLERASADLMPMANELVHFDVAGRIASLGLRGMADGALATLRKQAAA